MNSTQIFFEILGNAFYFDPHQSPRVLLAGRRDHPAYVTSCAAAREVSNICHDTCFDKVSTLRHLLLFSLAM